QVVLGWRRLRDREERRHVVGRERVEVDDLALQGPPEGQGDARAHGRDSTAGPGASSSRSSENGTISAWSTSRSTPMRLPITTPWVTTMRVHNGLSLRSTPSARPRTSSWLSHGAGCGGGAVPDSVFLASARMRSS